MRNLNIWIVNPFDPLPGESFRPGRYAYMVELLTKFGHQVTWWTSNFFHLRKQYRCFGFSSTCISKNLTINMISTPPYRKNIGLARLYNHYIYGKEFGKLSMKTETRPDLIIASVPPLDSAIAALQTSRRLGSKIVIDIQDLWPEFFITLLPIYLQPIGMFFLSSLFLKANYIYKNADAIIAVSRPYLNRGLRVSRNSKPSMVLHLGADLDFFDSYLKSDNSHLINKPENEIWVTFSGTLGRNCDLDTILKAAVIFSSNSNVKFIIAGDGPKCVKLKDEIETKGFSNVIFKGMLDYKELVYLLKSSDVALNASALSAPNLNVFIPTAPQTFPGKVFDYLAAGLPIINSVPGEVKSLLENTRTGFWYTAGDYKSLASAISEAIRDETKRKKMGKNARKLIEEHFDRNKEYLKLNVFLNNLVA